MIEVFALIIAKSAGVQTKLYFRARTEHTKYFWYCVVQGCKFKLIYQVQKSK